MTQDYFGTKRVTAWPQDEAVTDPQQAIRQGYGVQYADGYTSWSPKEVFEAAYQPITAMNFGHAIAAMRTGCIVARAGWNGKDMWIALQRRTGLSKMTLNYIFMKTAQRDLVPWLASQTDMLAEDWMIISEAQIPESREAPALEGAA